MKFVTFEVDTLVGPIARVGALAGNAVVDLAASYEMLLARRGVGDPRPLAEALIPGDMTAFLDRWPDARAAAEESYRFALDGDAATGRSLRLAPDQFRLRAAVRPRRIKDYLTFEQHKKNAVKRRGLEMPQLWYEVPSYSNRNVMGLAHPDEDILWPRYSNKLDFEFEIGLIVGRRGRDIRAEDAHAYIAGFTIYNDMSARDTQDSERIIGSGPGKSKDFDQGNVIGPCIATPDELDPADIALTLRVNGEQWATGSTAGMKHSWGKLLENASRGETIYPGDMLASGTMDGGCCSEQGRWIEPGALIEMEAQGIGVLRNRIVASPD